MSTQFADIVRPDRLGPALIAATGDERWGHLSATLIAGGKSNLTFLVRSEAGELVLRRPPTGTLLPKAHDMGREARVQNALADSQVPVPAIVLSDSGELLGVPCYVMERVAGHVIRDELPDLYATEDSRVALAHGFIDTLAHIHAADPAEVGLSDYGRPEGFAERQVRLWTGQWEKTLTHAVPEMTELGRRLAAQVPARQQSSIVHGDYRLDNLVMHPTQAGTVSAVLDWEMSTLGDPLTDLGLVLLFWRGPDDPDLAIIPGVSHLTGMPDQHDLLERYASRVALDLSDIGFYRALAHFKFAAVVQGVQSRSLAGATAGQDFGNLDNDVLTLATRGLDHL